MRHIRATHVGSLPRSQEVTDLLFSKEKNQSFDSGQFDKVMLEHVEGLVGVKSNQELILLVMARRPKYPMRHMLRIDILDFQVTALETRQRI